MGGPSEAAGGPDDAAAGSQRKISIPYLRHEIFFAMRRLNPDHLDAFALVVRLGSFSAAAARLNLTQPAVSLQLRELERRLGVRLIDRLGRRATATPAGEELLRHAARIDAPPAAEDALAASGEVGRGASHRHCLHPLAAVGFRLPGLETS
jgi:DNA-binding transcriptional LysR family regulator